MDFLKKAAGSLNQNQNQNQQQGSSGGEQQQGGNNNNNNGGGGFMDGITDKLNGAAGGGRESEKNEDYLDKGMLHYSCKSGGPY